MNMKNIQTVRWRDYESKVYNILHILILLLSVFPHHHHIDRHISQYIVSQPGLLQENTIMDMRFFHTGFYFGVYPVEA